MRSKFRLKGKSVFDLFYGFITFQSIASYDKYLIIPFSMSSRFHIIPHLIKEEKHDKAHEGAYENDKSWNSEKENESLSEVSDEGNGNYPIEPCFGKCLEISLDRFMKFIEIFDDTDDHKRKCGNDTERHILLIVDYRYLKLDSWYQISKETDSVHYIEYDNNQTKMKHWSKQTK